MADHFIDDAGIFRRLGNVERPAGLLRAWPEFGTTPETPMVPRSEWDRYVFADARDNPFLPPVEDQDGIGACNAFATCVAMEFKRAVQGLPFVRLSGGDLYRRICGGQDQGSTLEDGLHAAMTAGIASVATVPSLDWQRDHQGAAQERPCYRVLEAFICPTFDHMFSAAIAALPLIIGIPWYSGYVPDADGWLKPMAGRMVGGHALMSYAPAKRGATYGLHTQNQWQTSWGIGGRCVVPEQSFTQQVGGVWAVRSVVDEGNVVPIPTS